MMAVKRTTGSVSHWSMMIAIMLGVSAMSMLVVGCQSNDSAGTGSSLTAAVDSESAVEPITLDDVTAKVALNSNQETPLSAVLNRYNRAMESNRAIRQQNRADGERGFRGRRDGERPLHTLLKESAEILDEDQMVEFLALIKEQQVERRSHFREHWAEGTNQRGGKRGFGGRFAHQGQLFEDLNLTNAQQTKLTELRESHREQMMSLNNGKRGFGRSDESRALREQFREETEAILTPDQIQKLEELRQERRSNRHAVAQEGAAERQEARVELLTAVLNLSATQAAELETIMAETHEKMQALHGEMRGSDFDHDALREQIDQIRTHSHNAIGAILSDEQREVFDALTGLLPSGPRGHRRPH